MANQLDQSISVEQVNTIVATWEAIPFTARVLIISFIAVIMLTEMGKRVLLADIEEKNKKRRAIWGLSFILGALVAVSGYVVTDAMPNWFWLFVGATAGTVSNIIHHVVVKVWWKNRIENKNAASVRVVNRSQMTEIPKEEGDENPAEFIIKK